MEQPTIKIPIHLATLNALDEMSAPLFLGLMRFFTAPNRASTDILINYKSGKISSFIHPWNFYQLFDYLSLVGREPSTITKEL